MRHRFTKVLFGLVLFTMLAGTATVAAKSSRSTASYNVGIVYSRTGLLSAYGAEYVQGLKLGLQYATGGTNKVNGKDINLTLVDDKTDPATAVNAAKGLIGQGYKILAGSVSSGVALQVAPLAAQNKVLFISGPCRFRRDHRGQQVHVPLRPPDAAGRRDRELVPEGRRPARSPCFDQDSVFGHGNYAAVRALVGCKGHTVSEVSVPAYRDRLHAVRAAGQER